MINVTVTLTCDDCGREGSRTLGAQVQNSMLTTSFPPVPTGWSIATKPDRNSYMGIGLDQHGRHACPRCLREVEQSTLAALALEALRSSK